MEQVGSSGSIFLKINLELIKKCRIFVHEINNKNMRTLIIHPKDGSTTFLEMIYENIPNKTVITGRVSKGQILELIESHDRVMIMGHGSPGGLFNIGTFDYHGAYIIDYTMVEALSKKDNTVFIWCNADEFVKRYKLKGFYSGMFISEVGEAYYCGLHGTTQLLVDLSNYGFVRIVSECINESVEVIHKTVKEKYGQLAEENPVALYNNERIYLSV
jgi:hypothetical protein